MVGLQPFISYYGGKWRIAPKYPKPLYDTIIEPFAGSAGYATRYYQHKVILIEKYERLANMWQWLIKVKPNEILNLPLLQVGESIKDYPICDEAKTLIGYWVNKGSSSPSNILTQWTASSKGGWGRELKIRIARQCEKISHWKIIHGDYTKVLDTKGTWFIDPPYIEAGIHYKYSSKDIDYSSLGEWCQEREKQVIVCENKNADWLPFKPFLTARSTQTYKEIKPLKRDEIIWTKGCELNPLEEFME